MYIHIYTCVYIYVYIYIHKYRGNHLSNTLYDVLEAFQDAPVPEYDSDDSSSSY